MLGTGESTTIREPHFVLPLCRSEEFVGRGYILDKLEEIFTERSGYQPRAALWGLGGVG